MTGRDHPAGALPPPLACAPRGPSEHCSKDVRGQEPHGAFSVTERFRSSHLITSVSLIPKRQNTGIAGAPQSRTLGTPGGQTAPAFVPQDQRPPSLPCKAPAATESPAQP